MSREWSLVVSRWARISHGFRGLHGLFGFEGRIYSVDYSFPLQAGMLEVEQQSHFEVGDIQVAKHLGEVRFAEGRDDFGIDYDDAVNLDNADKIHTSVHGVDNLYIAGSSVFPSSGFANPTLTIVALALRLGDEVRRRLA